MVEGPIFSPGAWLRTDGNNHLKERQINKDTALQADEPSGAF